tara:strand:+ start:1066 stop:1179 length:114 start_codon:yes stop_codon:yes gene_type:complete
MPHKEIYNPRQEGEEEKLTGKEKLIRREKQKATKDVK